MRRGADGEAWLACGRVHLAERRFEAAVAAFDAALRACPTDPAPHYLRGEGLFLLRRLDEALESHAAAVCLARRSGAAPGAAMSGLVPGDFGWMSHMLRGDFESAWRLADRERDQRRRAGIDGAAWPRHTRPVWNGEALDGARVLVRCYHGLGDTIQFIRYAPLLAARAARVCVETQPELAGLLPQVPGIDALYPLETEDRGRAEYGCDAEIEVSELPHMFRTRLDTIPAAVPYLRPNPGRAAAAARRLAATAAGGKSSQGLAVGLVWAAGPWKPERSLRIEQLSGLAEIPGIALVNLQRGPEYRGWREARRALPMIEVFETDDIADTAATIAGLDLVITVDTMVAHLAGALGVPVWLLLHVAADWRWLLERTDSPWYPTMRLFRQQRPDDWDAPLGEIAAALAGHRRRGSGTGPAPESSQGKQGILWRGQS